MTGIYVDFHNTTSDGAVRMNTIGSIADLNRNGIILVAGLRVRLYSEDFEAIGVVEFSQDEHIWIARFDWEELRPVPPQREEHA